MCHGDVQLGQGQWRREPQDESRRTVGKAGCFVVLLQEQEIGGKRDRQVDWFCIDPDIDLEDMVDCKNERVGGQAGPMCIISF